jgi:hypothetical protein
VEHTVLMHTTDVTVEGSLYRIHHHGDWSRDAEIWKQLGEDKWQLVTELPSQLLIACGRQKAFDDVIRAVEHLE